MAFKKGSVPWNLGKIGFGKGRKHSQETVQKIKNKRAKQLFSEAAKQKMSNSHKGVALSEYHRNRIGDGHRGNKNSTWKGGVTKINQLLRHCKKYKIWREEVFKRDNFSCIGCGEIKNKLFPDHIIPLYKIIEKVKFSKGIKNLYRNCLIDPLFVDVSNGRTLCFKCHRKTDTWGNYRKC